MKKILVICPYPENVAPSQRLKFEQYYSFFREAGYKVDVRPFISPAFWKIIYKRGFFFQKFIYTLVGYIGRLRDLFSATRSDIVYVHLWSTPFGPPLFEWLFRRAARRMVYDIDDLIYLKNVESKAHPLVTLIKGRKKPLYLMKAADHVITCTPYLDEFVRKYNSNTTDISSTVDTERYQPVNPYTNKDIITIGWSGSLSTSKYFLQISEVLKKVAKQHKVKFLVMGDPGVYIEGLNLTALPWTEKDEISNLQKMDIGIYPLPDEEWVYGKSGLKAIQYMALGIPTVATAIGANFRVIENGVSGFLVKTENEWIDTISMLIEHPEIRERVGKKARERVLEQFSLEANKDKYLSVLKSSRT